MKYASAFLLCLLTMPSTVWGHPGHGHPHHQHDWLHYLLSAEHALLPVAAVCAGFLVIATKIIARRMKDGRSTRPVHSRIQDRAGQSE